MKILSLASIILVLLQAAGEAQLVLTGTNYVQNFNALSSSLPPGWSVRTNANASRLGGIATNYNAAGKSWADTTGEFGNCASTTANAGTNFIGTESSSIQSACTNRALAIRQTGVFGYPGAAFALQIGNTTGLNNLTFAADFEILKANTYSTTWTIQYAVGDSPGMFTTLGTFPDSGIFGATRITYHLGADANDQPSNLWIRVVALSAATGSGSRDTFALDNFSLSWTTNQPVIAPPCMKGICFSNGLAKIHFTGNTDDPAGAFIIQTADQISGPYADVAGGVISQIAPGMFQAEVWPTNLQQFYRIKRP